VGASFMLSTRARVNALASASSGDDDGTTHAENSVSGSYTYNSEQYLMAGFNYGFGFTASANRLSQQTDGQFTSENTVETNSGFGISHRANRTWLVGRASSLNLGLAQGLSAQLSGKTKGSGSITHSASSGLSTHTLHGTTFISVAASDSRSTVFQSLTESEQTQQPPRSQFQNISLNLSRTHYINRYSNMGGEMAYTSNRVNSNASGTYQSEINTGSHVTLHYQHSRLFTIYGMSLQSDLRYANTEGKEGRIAENTALSNKIYYSIGKLVTTLDFRVDRNAGGNPQYTLNFRATRSF